MRVLQCRREVEPLDTDEEAKTIRQAAYDWHMRLIAPNAGAQDQAALEVWLAADPRHEDAFERAAALYSATGELKPSDIDRDLLPPAAHRAAASMRRRRVSMVRRRAGLALSFAAIAAAFAVLSVPNFQAPANAPLITDVQAEHYASAPGEHRTVTLADGTHVSLGPASELRMTFAPGKRAAELHHGTAFFDVASDPSRPFEVASQKTTATVLGTQFDVRQTLDQTRIAVLEGQVEVAHPLMLAGEETHLVSRRVLNPGEQISTTRTEGL
ncbi:MAG: FecR domain-containing protein, partial [Pseudomonadota bacterium]